MTARRMPAGPMVAAAARDVSIEVGQFDGPLGATIAITEAALIAEYGRRCGIGGGDR